MATPLIDERRLRIPLLQLLEVEDFDWFWRATQAVFQAILPDDALTVYLNYFDFANSWKASAMFASADTMRSAEWHQQRRRVEVTTPFLTGHPGVRLYRLSAIFPSQEAFESSTLFQTFMRPYGWQDSVGLVYRRGSAVNSVISLRRPAERGAYRPEELRLLRQLHPHFESVISRLIESSERRAKLDWFENFNEHLPFALLQLDWELHLSYANREAMRQCCAWNYGPQGTARYNSKTVFEIPAPILDACRHLRQRWLERVELRSSEESNLSIRLVHPDHPKLRATVTLPFGGESRATRPVFVIWLAEESEAVAGSPSLSQLPAASTLTAAEREVTTLICSGCSNQEAATRLGKSRKTVAGQLTSAYRKLGVSGRARLIATLR